MRRFMIAGVALWALAACGQNNQPTQADGGGLFPDLSGSAYRADATISNADGSTMPVVMIRDGRNMRMEFTTSEGPSIVITNGETGESYMIATANGRQIAVRAAGLGDQVSNPLDSWQTEVAETATRTGNCSVAGENGAEWTKTTPEDGTDAVCVTQDGIILRATDDGRVAWETTSVQRGPQSADLFRLPEGVQVMDLGNMGSMMNQAIEAAKQRDN